MYSNGLRWRLTHGAAADVLGNLGLADRHHGNGGSSGKPIGLIIASGIVAHFIDVAVNERHGAEVGQAGTSKPWWKEKVDKNKLGPAEGENYQDWTCWWFGYTSRCLTIPG